MNVTSKIVRDYGPETRMIHNSPNDRGESSAPRVGLTEESDLSVLAGVHRSGSITSPASGTILPIPSNDESYASEDDMHGPHENHLEIQDTGFETHGSYQTPGIDPSMFAPLTIADYGASSDGILLSPGINAESAAAHLLALRGTHPELPAVVNGPEQIPSAHAMRSDAAMDVTMLSPNFGEDIFGDGIFLPGSTYQELHTTLRNCMFYTARSNATGRYGTPDHELEKGNTAEQDSDQCLDITATATLHRHESDNSEAVPHKAPEFTQHQEYELWKNYLDELAPWVCIMLLLRPP